MDRGSSNSFRVVVGMRHGCVISPWLFNMYMDEYIRDMRVGVRNMTCSITSRSCFLHFCLQLLFS